MIYLLQIICSFVLGGAFAAAERSQGAEGKTMAEKPKIETVTSKKWKARTDKFFYDLQGKKEARDSIYAFDKVTTDTQLLSLNYSATPTLSLSFSGLYNKIYAETYFSGVLYKDRTEGFGDVQLKGSKTLLSSSGVYILEIGTSLPTGSITKKNKNAPSFNYPYNMQLGSGTMDIVTSFVYVKPMGSHSIGALSSGTFRMGRNSEGYRKGNEGIFKTWYAYNLRPYLSPGIWANYHQIDAIKGQDKTFGRSSYTEFYHASRSFWDLTPHINSEFSLGSDFKLRGSLGSPIYQHSKNVDDVQVYVQWFAQLGLEGSF